MYEQLTDQYLNMLVQQSYLNENKLGPKADSVGSKLESIKLDILQAVEDAKQWNILKTHTKYHNVFGCAYHFNLKEEQRKNQFLQSEIQSLKREIEEIKKRK